MSLLTNRATLAFSETSQLLVICRLVLV